MDAGGIIDSFSKLGPALGAVVAVAGVSYFAITGILKILQQVLSMFDKHGQALNMVSENMNANTGIMREISANVSANTRVTEKMVDLIERKIG